MLTNIFAITAGLAATASAFDCSGHYFSFFNRAGPMSYQRLDPGVYPGVESPHLHSFDGGDGLAASMGFDTTQSSTCTTARIKSDKSLYWRPTLFFGNETGFYRVPEKASKTYYKSGDGDKWANVTEFPENFNMVAGDQTKRADGDNAAGVRWACHQPDGGSDKVFTPGFPTGFTSCAYGFASEITFPSCWNGKKMDPAQTSAHMAYPTNGGVGIENCPSTHRVARFPTIFMEFWYDISSFDKQYSASSSPWVLSTGDTTGYGFHADFMNGWEKGVLAKATGETGGCNCGWACGNDEMKQCFGAEDVNDDSDSGFKQCSANNAFDDLSMSHFETLPGCNPLQSGAGCDSTGMPGSGSASNQTVTSTLAASQTASPISGSYNEATSTIKSQSTGAATKSKGKNRTRTKMTASRSVAPASKADAYPTVGADLTNKGLADAAGDGYNMASPLNSAVAKPTPSTLSNANANGKSGGPTACSQSLVYKTVTETSTVTISAKY